MALKPVEIAIRAKDQTKAGINSATSGLERFAAAQARTNSRRMQIGTMKSEALELGAAYRVAADRANELGQKIAAAKRPSKALRDEFAATRVEAAKLKAEAIAMGTAVRRATEGKTAFNQLGTGASARGAGSNAGAVSAGNNEAERSAFAAAAAIRNQESAVEELTRAEANLLAVQRSGVASGAQLVAAQTRVTRAYKAREAAVIATAAAQKRADLASQITGAYASRTGRGPLGLRPYELQNLSYQVNDFFTQIASGTPVTQAFAQQFGQVAQLFPAAISGFVRFIPIIGLATLALAPFVAKLVEVRREAANLKAVEQLLRRSGEAASYTAPQLKNLVSALDDYGASAEEARKIVAALVDNSVAPEYLERFGRTAIDTAKALGIDLADATTKVTEAFTGNADAILALDDEINFLTDSERAYAETLKAQKRDIDLRTYAFGIYEKRMDDVSRKQTGPWSQSLKSFGASFKAFVDYINAPGLFDGIKANINQMLAGLARLANMLPGAQRASIGAINQRIGALDAEMNNRRSGNFLARTYGVSDNQIAAERQYLVGRREILTANENGGLLGPTPDGADTTLDPPATAVQDKASRGGGKSDAQKRAEDQAEFVKGLEAENAAREFQISLVNQSERAQAVANAVRTAELAAREVGLRLTAEQRAEIVRTTKTLFDEQAALKANQLIEAARLQLAEARGEIESEGDYVTRMQRENGFLQTSVDLEGNIVSLLQEGGLEYGNTLRLLYQINEAKRQGAALDKQVTDLTSMRTDLMSQITFYEDAGQGAQADALRTQLVSVNAELLTAIERSIAFWQTQTGPEAQSALLNLGFLRDQIRGVGEAGVFSGKQINDSLASGGAQAFDSFAQKLVKTRDLFGSLRDAFLQFAADFLRQIAQMIIQQAILNALGASKGGGGGAGGGIAGFLNGLFGKAGVKHEGGIAGAVGRSRSVSVGSMLGAMRYHSGGIAGMRPDEVSAILKRGEEVLTEEDPRHRNNLGQGGSNGGLKAKIVNLFDAPDMLSHALADSRGEEVILNHVRSNPGAWRAAIGV